MKKPFLFVAGLFLLGITYAFTNSSSDFDVEKGTQIMFETNKLEEVSRVRNLLSEADYQKAENLFSNPDAKGLKLTIRIGGGGGKPPIIIIK